jgi:hypothetical protein
MCAMQEVLCRHVWEGLQHLVQATLRREHNRRNLQLGWCVTSWLPHQAFIFGQGCAVW